MANLVLFTTDQTHSAATNTKTALQNKGHTVTMVNDGGIGGAGVTATSVAAYDAMVGVRLTSDTGVANALATKVQAGKPLALGMVDAGLSVGTGNNVVANRMHYQGVSRVADNSGAQGEIINVTDVSHIISSYLSVGNLTVMSGANFSVSVQAGQTHIGTKLGQGPVGDPTAGEPTLYAIERGTLNQEVVPVATGARVVVWGNLYAGQAAYAAAGETLLDHIIQWLLVPFVATRGLVVGSMTLN